MTDVSCLDDTTCIAAGSSPDEQYGNLATVWTSTGTRWTAVALDSPPNTVAPGTYLNQIECHPTSCTAIGGNTQSGDPTEPGTATAFGRNLTMTAS